MRRKPTERQFLERKLDHLVSRYVLARDGGCVTPGKCNGRLTCSHYYGRGRSSVRFDLINCNCQCQAHNLRHNHYQFFYEKYMLEHYGAEEVLALAKRAGQIRKCSVPELVEMIKDLEAKIASLGR